MADSSPDDIQVELVSDYEEAQDKVDIDPAVMIDDQANIWTFTG